MLAINDLASPNWATQWGLGVSPRKISIFKKYSLLYASSWHLTSKLSIHKLLCAVLDHLNKDKSGEKGEGLRLEKSPSGSVPESPF